MKIKRIKLPFKKISLPFFKKKQTRNRITFNRRKKFIKLDRLKFLFALVLVLIAIFGIMVIGKYAEEFKFSLQPDDNKIKSPQIKQNEANDFENVLKEKHIEYDSLQTALDGKSITTKTQDDIKVIFSPIRDVSWQVSTLQLILARLTIDKDTRRKKVVEIDFRFDKPIIRY